MQCRCSICLERVDPSKIAGLRCGHAFDLKCISDWLSCQTRCPICSADASTADIRPVFLCEGEDSPHPNGAVSDPHVATLKRQISVLKDKLETADQEAMTMKKRADKLEYEKSILMTDLRTANSKATVMEKRADQLHSQVSMLTASLGTANSRVMAIRKSADELRAQFHQSDDALRQLKKSISDLKNEKEALEGRMIAEKTELEQRCAQHLASTNDYRKKYEEMKRGLNAKIAQEQAMASEKQNLGAPVKSTLPTRGGKRGRPAAVASRPPPRPKVSVPRHTSDATPTTTANKAPTGRITRNMGKQLAAATSSGTGAAKE